MFALFQMMFDFIIKFIFICVMKITKGNHRLVMVFQGNSCNCGKSTLALKFASLFGFDVLSFDKLRLLTHAGRNIWKCKTLKELDRMYDAYVKYCESRGIPVGAEFDGHKDYKSKAVDSKGKVVKGDHWAFSTSNGINYCLCLIAINKKTNIMVDGLIAIKKQANVDFLMNLHKFHKAFFVYVNTPLEVCFERQNLCNKGFKLTMEQIVNYSSNNLRFTDLVDTEISKIPQLILSGMASCNWNICVVLVNYLLY